MLNFINNNYFSPIALFIYEIVAFFLILLILLIPGGWANSVVLKINTDSLINFNNALVIAGLITVVLRNRKYIKAMKKLFLVLVVNSFLVLIIIFPLLPTPSVKIFETIAIIIFNIFILYKVIFNKSEEKFEN